MINRRYVRGDGRFLITRDLAGRPQFFDRFLNWMASELPDVRRRFELRLLPYQVGDPSRYVLHLPWMQDPVQAYSPDAYEQTLALSRTLASHGIPTINPVDRLAHAGKTEGARRIRTAGIRTPNAVLVEDVDAFRRDLLGLELPIIVREDWGHGHPDALETGMVVRCDSLAEARAVDLSRFQRPMAMEFVETGDPDDGLYRKYRYIAAGDLGTPYHIQAKPHWYAKGAGTAYNQALHDQDVAFLSKQDPNHAVFQDARRALGLDFVAFDYSYTPEGELVVWEANPMPFIQFIPGKHAYRAPAVTRTFASMLHLQYTRAGLPVPLEVEARLPFPSSGPVGRGDER